MPLFIAITKTPNFNVLANTYSIHQQYCNRIVSRRYLLHLYYDVNVLTENLIRNHSIYNRIG